MAIDELKSRDQAQKDAEKDTQRRILELQKRMAE